MGGKRVQSDGNGGHFIRVEKKEWGRVVLAASIVMSSVGYAGKTIIDDVITATRGAPMREYRIAEVEKKVKALEAGFVELNGTLIRLTSVLESLEAQMQEENR